MNPVSIYYDRPDSVYQTYKYLNAKNVPLGTPLKGREATWQLSFPNYIDTKDLPFSTNVNQMAFKAAYDLLRQTNYEEQYKRNN